MILQKHGREIVKKLKEKIKTAHKKSEPVRLTIPATKNTSWYEGHYVRGNNRAGEIRFEEDSKASMPYVYKLDRRTSRLLEKAMQYEAKGSDSGVQEWMGKLVELAQKYRSALSIEEIRASYRQYKALPLKPMSAEMHRNMKRILKDGIENARNNTIHIGVLNRACMIDHHRRSQEFDVVYQGGEQCLQVTSVEHYTTNLNEMDYCHQISKRRYMLDNKLNALIADALNSNTDKTETCLQDLSAHIKMLSLNASQKRGYARA